MKKPDTIEQAFLKDFTKAILFAVKKELRRGFRTFSHPVMEIQQPMEAPIESEETENNEKIIVQSETPRLLIAPKRIPLSQVPLAIPVREINLSSQGLPVPQSMFPVEPTLTYSIKQITLEKVKNILLDPGVFSVECPGPSKPLVITAGGITRNTNIILTEEEISSFMQDIAKKTRIPLLVGLYKAIFGNLLIIAVISEFVGTRFLVQKRIIH